MKFLILSIFVYIVQFLFPSILAEQTSCADNHMDIEMYVQDFGRNGVKGPINVTLGDGLQIGAVISVVAKSKDRGTINLLDNTGEIIVLHIDARINAYNMSTIVLNTYVKDPCNGWCEEKYGQTMPVKSDTRTTTTIMFEAEGYRIFVNRQEIAFYYHMTNSPVHTLNIKQDQVYKIMYFNQQNI